MILSESKLDERLEDWRREYGWGGMPHGSNCSTILAKLIQHKGFVPTSGGMLAVTIKTKADEVDAAVVAMQSMRGEPGRPNLYFRASMVLRCEYLTPYDWPESERLDLMGRIGMSMSRTTYYEAIRFGKSFLLGALSKPIHERVVGQSA